MKLTPFFLYRIKSLKAHLTLIAILLFLATFFQLILASKHFEFGFFIDDWIFLSIYKQSVDNPILDAYTAWRDMRSHTFAHAYYIGLLFDFFGFNYLSYNILNQLLKIFSVVSIYPIIFMLFRSKLVAFLAVLIYGIHYSPYGVLDNASRGEDFIAVILMVILLMVYLFLIKRRITNFKIMLGVLILFFLTLFIDPTRMFPLAIIIPSMEVIFYFHNWRTYKINLPIKRLAYIFTPFMVLYLISPDSINSQLFYFDNLFTKISVGNFQLFLTPFASFGSMFLPREIWPLLKIPSPSDPNIFFQYALNFLLPSFLFIIFTLGFLSFGWNKNLIFIKNRKFLIRTLVLVILFTVIAFLLGNSWYGLKSENKGSVDPGIFFLPALVGFFVLGLAISFMYEVKKQPAQRNLCVGLLYSILFSLVFIVLTWIWADVNSIFMGVHAYLNIPAIGVSVFLAILLTLAYIRNKKLGNIVIPIVLLSIFAASYFETNKYFSYWLDNGLKAKDQEIFISKFWQEVGYDKHFGPDNLPLFYFDTSEDYKNGVFYDHVIIHKIWSWLIVRPNEYKSGRVEYCDSIILLKKDLIASVKTIDGKRVLYRDKCGRPVVYKTENFYAFMLKNKDLIPITADMLKELKIDAPE